MDSLKQHAFWTFMMIVAFLMLIRKTLSISDTEGEVKKTASEGFAALVERLTKPKP